MRIALRGVVSDAEAMASVQDILSLKLVRTGDDAIRLATVVAALGSDMNQVVLALTNQTTMRFDQIGIAVGGFEDKLKSLEAQGLSTQDAFTEAFLLQAEEQIARTGHVADTTAGAFLRLEAGWKNFTDQLKKDASGALLPVIEALGNMDHNQRVYNQALDDGVISEGEFNQAIQVKNGLFEKENEWLVIISERYAELEARLLAINEAEASWDAAKRASVGAIEEQVEALFDLTAALSDLQLFVDGPLGRSFEMFAEEQDALILQAAMLRDEIAYLEGQPQTAEGQQHLAELRGQMAEVHQEIINTSMAWDEQTRRVLLDLIIQRAAIAELPEDMRAAAFQMINDIAFAWGLIDQTTYEAVGRIDQAFALLASGNVQAAQQEIMELGGWANSVATDYYIRFHIVVDQMEAAQDDAMPYEGQGGGGVGGAVDNLIPPGTSGWTPPAGFGGGGGGGFSGGMADVPELPPTLREMAAPFLDTAQALSQIGNFFAQMLQDELIDPLQKKIDAIDALLSPQHIDLVARERALELEQERAKAAEELAEAQEKILLLQKAQMQLQFLEYQIKLLDLIKQHNLNAEDILGGLELGIDADAGAVVEAMAKAIQKLIEQAEKELGIASPSKVAEGWGRAIIEGLKVGMSADLQSFPNMEPTLANALFSGAGSSFGGVAPAGGITINVYPSEGMDEEALARKVGAVIQKKIML